MNNKSSQEPIKDYEAFKRTLQEKIQALVDKPINFLETESVGINETLEGLILKLDGENAAPIIYPQKLYEGYRVGIPLPSIAASAADIVSKACEYPKVSDLTSENAQKCIRFALINRERNRKLLETCPYKEVLDLAAIPRWYTDRGSFLVDNDIMLILGMTREDVLRIAERNTKSEHYVCKNIKSMIREAELAAGTDAELLDELYLARKSPLHILTNQTGIDGSRAILSDQFLQEVAQRLGADELCLLPSSRDEMLAADTAVIGDIAKLKNKVMSVNRDPGAVQTRNILSDSVYSYNTRTHSLSVYPSTSAKK